MSGFDLGSSAVLHRVEFTFAGEYVKGGVRSVSGEAFYTDDDVREGNQSIPRKILFRSGGGDEPWLTLGIEIRGKVPTCTYLEFDSASGAAVQDKHLNVVHIEQWVKQIVATCASEMELLKKQRPGRRGYRLIHGPATPEQLKLVGGLQRRRTSPQDDRELLERVAAIYKANPDAPLKAVAAEFDRSIATAGRWVGYASEANLLPKAKQGKKRI